jgi:hypothetical protein
MQPEIVIVDTRPLWMQKEDQKAFCSLKCKLFKQCSSRVGSDCRHYGGSVIPKIRNKELRS